MSWKDKLHEASFRNVKFYFERTGGEIGRKIALHEYPGRDLPYAEDLGKVSHKIEIEIYVMGSDYMDYRDQLVKALESPGPGTFVHPYRGPLTVAVLSARGPIESTQQGGMARFNVTFVETDENRLPVSSTGTARAVKSISQTVITDAKADFAKKFAVSKKPSFITDAAAAIINDFLGKVESVVSMPFTLSNGVSGVMNQIGSIKNRITDLMYSPASLASSIFGLIDTAGALISLPSGLKHYDGLFNFGDDYPAVSGSTVSTGSTASSAPVTVNRKTQATNQLALTDLVKQSAAVTAASNISDVEFDSNVQAMSIRDTMSDLFDGLMDTASDTVYPSLWDLRGALIKDISVRGASSARLIAYTPKATLPALVVAHKIYDDAARADEIVTRNRIRHPGFVPGNVPMEIKLDA